MPPRTRRQVLAATGSVGGLLAGAGCLSSLTATPPPSVSTTGVTVRRGETGRLALEVEQVRMLGFRHAWGADKHFVDYDAERVSPVPDEGMDSYPPYWVWDDTKEEVSVGLAVAPPSGLAPGRYDLVVRVWQSRELDKEPATTATAAIEVR